MTNNVNLNVSSAIIPYTPPKSAEEFVNGEVVKKAHEIFEKAIHFKAIHFHLKECKLLKTPDDLFLRWKHLANTKPISESDDFFSILREQEVLLPLFSFLDRNSLQNLTLYAKNVKKNVDQYVEQGFEHYFGMSCKTFQELTNCVSFNELDKMLIKAIKNDATEIVFEKFLSILLPKIDQSEFEEILYPNLQKAIENHASADTILAFLRATTRFGKICNENHRNDLIELALKEKIATKEIIEALLNAGSVLDNGPACTINVALKHRASNEIIEALLKAGAVFDTGPECTIYRALEYGASAEVIKTLMQAGARVDSVHINDARGFNASAEVIELFLYPALKWMKRI